MSLNNNQLYSVAHSLAKLVKDEYGENKFIGFSKIIKLCKTDHFGELILSKTTNTPEKIKVIFMTYLIITGGYKKETIIGLSSNLYLYVIDFYDDTEVMMGECQRCEGSGEENCDNCDGTGNLDCKYCDGDGEIECTDCWGEGTKECRSCDGKGTETEEDDEGEEVEVECSSCDGSGNEDCRGCLGTGSFDCDECSGSGNNNCEECGGHGVQTCEYCGGDGEQETGEEKYSIMRTYYVTLGNKLSEYMGDTMLLSDFEQIDGDDKKVPYSFTVSRRYFPDDDNTTKEDRQESVDLDDNFVEFIESYKLENYPNNINF